MALLSVHNLCISVNHRGNPTPLVDQLSFSLNRSETLAIVGESGSGKSLSCDAIMGLLTCPPMHIDSGEILFNGVNLLPLPAHKRRAYAGTDIGRVFQDPMSSLTPHLRIEQQMTEALLSKPQHHHISKAEAKHLAKHWLVDVGIDDSDRVLSAWPHQLSGGMRQRVMIAMALIEQPKLLIADEPTTALDATTQKHILTILKQLQQKHQLSLLFISHDLAVVKSLADHVLVLKNGVTQEYATAENLFQQPQTPYTQQLINAVPRASAAATAPSSTVTDTPLLCVNGLYASYSAKPATAPVVQDVSFELKHGEILGLVGESGSGKSTLGRCIAGLHKHYQGTITFQQTALDWQAKRHWFKPQRGGVRQNIQMVFQDPMATLNPRRRIFDTLAEPMRLHGLCHRSSVVEAVAALLADVELDTQMMHRYPHQLSGGQRQRVAIARALACQPKLIIADEPVSALDVTVQAQLLDLLLTLCHHKQLSILFISHDLSVVRYLCDRVMVMKHGNMCEINTTEGLWSNPQSPYTQTLLASTLAL